MTENDIEIELQGEERQTQSNLQLPMNFLALGEIENDDVKVYIHQSTYKALEKLASSDTTRELGSILIGSCTEELGKTHVVISDYIEAKYTDASASTLTFTHETWDYVYKTQSERYPDKKIIGWQHTHPNYGIFLSNYDMFIQENFFNLPFQVAYVIDPIQNLRGFFQWKNGKVEKLKGYYIYDEVGKTIRIDTPKKKPVETTGKGKAATGIIIGLLCAAILGVSLWGGWMKLQNVVLEEDNNTLRQRMSERTEQETVPPETTPQTGELEATIQAQEEKIRELETKLAATEGQTAIRLISYTVEAGDSLSAICSKNGIDYGENAALILAINEIDNADLIDIGQVLLLPIPEA